jgi:phosphate starvation-inducible protein PhoH
MVSVDGKTENQKKILIAARKNHLIITGHAGTGKTFLSCAAGLERVFSGKNDRIILCRTAVPSRDMGFIPGTIEEKQAPYEAPYRDTFNQLMGRGDGYELLKKSGQLEFETSSFLRGITMRGAVVIVDEAQNWTFRELDTVMTRAGEGSVLFFCGDTQQTDFTREEDFSGFENFLSILHTIEEFVSVEMTEDDVVRSGIVQKYLKAKNKLASKAVHRRK